MHIAGGLYRERCYIPHWNALFGSGGRAAAAVSAMSPGSTLHCYFEDQLSDALSTLKSQNIQLNIHNRATPISFTYFHPLSRPLLEPSETYIAKMAAMRVTGETVLRFGMIEGDAVVTANRAIYDPQTWKNPTRFSANGSTANELAIVLNEAEMRSIAGTSDLAEAASYIKNSEQANLVVCKQGAYGVTIFENNRPSVLIPAYRSSAVFKIGSGDVFSAIFAHFWGEERESASKSADLASRCVSTYCETKFLPVHLDDLLSRIPVRAKKNNVVLLLGRADSIGSRYTMEEARFVLEELGAKVQSPSLGTTEDLRPDSILLISDDHYKRAAALFELGRYEGLPITLLVSNSSQVGNIYSATRSLRITDDFSTALYCSIWGS